MFKEEGALYPHPPQTIGLLLGLLLLHPHEVPLFIQKAQYLYKYCTVVLALRELNNKIEGRLHTGTGMYPVLQQEK